MMDSSLFKGETITKPVHIECPECEEVQPAKIVASPNFPFAAYIHDCERCAYTIMESEWNEVSAPEKPFYDPNQLVFDFAGVE